MSIDILKGGRAYGNPKLKNLIDSHLASQYSKNQFYKKYNDGRTQGIIVEFSGKLIESRLPDFKNKSNVCLLALEQIEDPQNFGQIIRTAECAGIEGIIYSKHHSVPLTDTALQVSQGAFVNMKFYEVQEQLNNLYWRNLAYFKKKEDAEAYCNLHNTRVVTYPVRVQERKFTNIKDFEE